MLRSVVFVVWGLGALVAAGAFAQEPSTPAAPATDGTPSQAATAAQHAAPSSESTDTPAPIAAQPAASVPRPVIESRPADVPTPVVPLGPNESDFIAARTLVANLEKFVGQARAEIGSRETRRATEDARLLQLSARVESAAPGSRDADQIDEQLVDELQKARTGLRASLDALGLPSEVPSTDSIGDVSAGRLGDVSSEWLRLTARIDTLEREARELEEKVRWARVTLAGEALQRLTASRAESMARCSLARRDEIFGISRAGFAQLKRELAHFVLTVRYYGAVRRHETQLAPRMVGDLFAVGGAIYLLIRLAIVLAIALFIRSKWRKLLEAIRGPLFRSFRSIEARRRVERLIGLVEVAFPWLLLLLTVHFAERALLDAARAFEVVLVASLLVYYALYRLAIDLVVAGLLRLSTRYKLAISEERRLLLERSVIVFFRVVFGLTILIFLSNRIIGGGYLSHLASRFAGMVIAITLLLLMLRWRRELADAFLAKHPEGTTADLVRRTRDSWLGVFVAPASFLSLLGSALAVLTRDFALGFEQTQRALAFLFRRKIERQAEKEGYAAGNIAALPPAVVRAFSEDPIERGPALVEHFPGLDRLRADVSLWRDSERGGSFLLTGERGIGKSSWLHQIRRDDLEVARIELGDRVTTKDALYARLAEKLGAPDPSPEGLLGHLTAGEPRLVIFDIAQHLFLSKVGGYEAWAAFAELVNATRHRVYWIAAMSMYAWRHLRAVRDDWTVFLQHQQLPSWNEERIRELMRARMKASGLHYNFSNLMLERLEGVSSRDHLIESEEGYSRLLWDYSDGNPRVALHYFARSLDCDSDLRLRVRLFRAPDVAILDRSGEEALFILACIVTHESIAPDDIALATRYAAMRCRIHIDRLLADGIVQADGELLRVTTHWHRAVVRTLNRRNMLTV